MSTNENCDLKPMEKLCNPEEAKLLWDEYKYRHDLIWKHLIRSTIAVIILITVPYSTKIAHDKYLIWGSSIAAFIYLCHTFWVTFRENKLLEKVKVLHRKRQMHYLELPSKNCLTWDKNLKGNFLGRIVGYLILLLLLVIYAISINVYAKGSAVSTAPKDNTSLKNLSNSEITVSNLIQSNMTLDELISRLNKDADAPDSGKTEVAVLAELTAAIDKLTNVIGEQGGKIIQKSNSKKKPEIREIPVKKHIPPPVPDVKKRLLQLQTSYMQGDDVKKVQQALLEAGFQIDVDGIFGSQTNKAVVQFQQQRKLVVDGIVGPATLAALEL